MSRNAWLVCKSNHFELTLNIAFNAHCNIFRSDRSRFLRTLFLFHFFIVWFFWRTLSFKNCLILLRDRNKLFTVKICFSLHFSINCVLIRIIHLSVCSLQCDSRGICIRITLSNFAESFQSRECLFSCSRVYLHTNLQVLCQIKIASVSSSCHYLALFELLTDFYSNFCRKDCAFNPWNNLQK